MTADEMILIATRLFPNAEVHEEDGELTIVTGVKEGEPLKDFDRTSCVLAAGLCGGVIEDDNNGQWVIYTGYIEK